ncbi:MAG: thiamine pyrophosphate-dependent enzyme [Terracidiphilus sp.]
MTTRTNEQGMAPLGGNNGFSLISNEKLIEFYAAMVKCRMIGERARFLLRKRESTGNEDGDVGREAIAVGVAIDLLPEDTVTPPDHDLMVNLVRGVPLGKIFGHLAGGAARPSFAERVKLATGAAQANQTAKNGKIAVVFSGSGFTPPGFLHEALTAAGGRKLPMIFVSHSSFLTEPGSLDSPTGAEEIAARACGVPVIAVDGNDVVAVYRVATEAIAHARKGNGPTLIECGVERAQAQDPVLSMEEYLARKGMFSAEMKREAAAGFAMELDDANEAVEGCPPRSAAKQLLTC